MTKHQIIEEPCDGKLSRMVLKTSGTGDSLAEFNIGKSEVKLMEGCYKVSGASFCYPILETTDLDYKMGLTPEEVTQEIPHLTLSQVYAALAFYHTNKDMIEADIAAQEVEAERLDAVSLVPVESDMTIEEAALFLNVSEIFINKLLSEGEIKYVMVESERRICLADLMAYKKQLTVKRREILRELAQFSQEEELNDKRVYS